MRIILETPAGTVELDLSAQTLTAAIPVTGQQAEIRVEDGDPPIVHLTLPFGEVEGAEVVE